MKNIKQTYFFLYLLFFVLLFCLNLNIKGQQTTELNIYNNYKYNIFNIIKEKYIYPDSATAANSINIIIKELINEGYAAAIIDSTIHKKSTINVYINSGQKYSLIKLSANKSTSEIIENSGFRKSKLLKNAFRFDYIKNLSGSVLTYMENNGYPFATFNLDSVTIGQANGEINAIIKVDKGPLILMDSIILKKNPGISNTFIYNYLGIKPGSPYNEKKIKESPALLKKLSFLSITGPSETKFSNNKAIINLYCDKKKANDFSGIIGFMPDNSNNGHIQLSGDIKLKLNNTLKYGELFSLNWRKTEKLSQELKTIVDWPYIFGSFLGIENKLNILKKDSSYITINNRAAIKYIFNGICFLKSYYETKNSNLVSTAGLKNITTLPQYADIKNSLYGLEFYVESLNNRFNPRKGYSLLLNCSAGWRKIEKNQKVNPVVYDNLNLKSNQYRLEEDMSLFIPFARQSTLGLFSKNAFISGGNLFTNELYRIGGLNSLRGFDEESIYASAFSVASIEYRYLLDESSFISLFFDGAYYESRTINSFLHDTPFGFGAGITFDTKAGLFTLNYAIGHEHNNPLDFRNSKLHFGLTAKL